ncbi:MAG: hypothetical protein KO202_06505 [Methanobacteriaceae archaeon]|jgi:hypothetical protein|nr:hypothetical protein [Methanobacteriaceae archaeon]
MDQGVITKKLKKYLKKQYLFLIQDIFSDANLKSAEKHEINGLIMPKIIAKQNNNKIRKENIITTQRKKKNKKYSKNISKESKTDTSAKIP